MSDNVLLHLGEEPRFDQIKTEDIKPALQTAITEAREQIAAIKAQTHTDWANTVEKLTDITERVGRIWSVVSHLNSVVDTPELRAAYNELMPEITIFFTEIGQDIELYNRFKIIKNSAEFDTLSPAQQTKLNHDLRDFVLSGAELPPEQQAELAQLQTEGAQLGAKFAQNIQDATDAFGIYFDDAAPLAGIPEDSLAMFAAAAQSEGKTGYKIGLQIPHYLAVRMKSEDYDKVNYDMAMHIYGDRFADPNNFIFTFVGNIDPATFEPMIEQYLGSLPATSRNETWKDNGMNITEKNIICHYEKEMETPKATCYMVYNGKMEYTLENQIYMNVFTDIMDIVYTEKIREDEGGTYGVGVNGSVSNRPDDYFVLLVGFETNKDMYEKLMGIAKAELENIAEVGPRPQDLKKVKEFMLKNHAEKMERNGYWMNAIESNQRDGINPMKDYESILNGISIESMAQFGKRLISAYKKEIVQLPK